MKTNTAFAILVIFLLGLLLISPLQADVVILKTGYIITGNVLQQDDDGILIQLDYGTYRYLPLPSQAILQCVSEKNQIQAPTTTVSGQLQKEIRDNSSLNFIFN